MDLFLKTIAMALLAVILTVTLGKTEKDISLVLSITACCAVTAVASQYLSQVIGFLWELRGDFDAGSPFLEILLKISGVALMTELSGVISGDAGNSALCKAIQILGSAAILYLSLPLLEGFHTVIREILGNL